MVFFFLWWQPELTNTECYEGGVYIRSPYKRGNEYSLRVLSALPEETTFKLIQVGGKEHWQL